MGTARPGAQNRGAKSTVFHLSNVSKGVIEPVVNSAKSEPVSAHLAVSSGTLGSGKANECPGTGEVFVEFFGLTLEKHVFFRVEDERRAGDLFSDAVLKVVFERCRNIRTRG
jgi:hypothetical protein